MLQKGHSVLWKAGYKGHRDIVLFLLQNGGDVDLINNVRHISFTYGTHLAMDGAETHAFVHNKLMPRFPYYTLLVMFYLFYSTMVLLVTIHMSFCIPF